EQEDPVPPSGGFLAQRLRGWDEKIWCGSEISTRDSSGAVNLGTLGVFIKRGNGQVGFLTCSHVAKAKNTAVYHPWAAGSRSFNAGTSLLDYAGDQIWVEVDLQHWYGDFGFDPSDRVRVDYAFVPLLQNYD